MRTTALLSRGLLVAAGLALASTAAAAVIDVPETFDLAGTPSANGWTTNSGGVFADAGDAGAGDAALLYSADNTGFHLLHPESGSTPDPTFLGDYDAAGVVAIEFLARHSGAGSDVTLRAVLFDDFADGNDWAFSTGTAFISASATDWQLYSILVDGSSLTAGGVNGRSVDDIRSAVAQVGLRHDPAGTGPRVPSPIAAQVWFDDITLRDVPAPEPGLVVLLASGLLALAGAGRRVRA